MQFLRVKPAGAIRSDSVGQSNHLIKRSRCLTYRSSDDGLDQVLQQVDEISHTLRPDSPESQKLSDALKLTVSCAIRQTLLERELCSLALTDELTGLYNRRGFWASATQQLRLAHRNTQEALIFFCDVDNLKQINDSYGHGEGDRALVRAANALAQTFRNSDILARLGGDEFAVLASEASVNIRKSSSIV